MNEKIFTLILVVFAGLALLFLPGSGLAAAEIITLRLVYLALLLLVTVAFVFFLRGTKFDVYAEIFDRHNVAGAIVVAAMIIGAAMVIGR